MIHAKADAVSDPQQTLSLDGTSSVPPGAVRRFRLTVVEGPKAGMSWESSSDRCSVGFHPSNDLVVEDATVSRFHCEVRIADDGAHVRDLDSRNGTVVDGVRVSDAFLRAGSLVKMGRVGLRFEFSAESNRLPVSTGNAFGKLVGASVAMRTSFALLERAAQSDVTVLVEGETGTGKGVAAEAIHRASARANGPFLVVDCGAIPPNLLESELFGHEKGAFTGAVSAAEGKFGAAKGGTIFLDEVSTMSDRAQVDLLRVLETFKYTRVGGKVEHSADVRVVCATNRDLLQMAQEAKFREDLYYRINIFPITLPPLRQRLEDIGLLADRFMRAAAERYKRPARMLPEGSVEILMSYAWPGNVRELRNLVEQAVLLEKSERLEPELLNRLLVERPQRPSAPPASSSTITRYIGRDDQTPGMGLPLPAPVVPIAVGTKVEDAERQLALRTLEAYAGDRVAACAALGVDSARLDELLGGGNAPQPAVPHN